MSPRIIRFLIGWSLLVSVAVWLAVAEDTTKPDPQAITIQILTAQRDASNDQVELAGAIITMNAKRAIADASQATLKSLLVEYGKLLGCEIDQRTAECPPPPPSPAK